MTAILICLILVCNGWSRCSSCVDYFMTINIGFSSLGLVLNAICSDILFGSSICYVWNLLRGFRCCCLFFFSFRLLYNSSSKLLDSVRVSLFLDKFKPSKLPI